MNENKVNKKIAAVIVTAALIVTASAAAAYAVFAPKTMIGDWELVVNPEIGRATPDEPSEAERVYYTFGKPNEYGDGYYKTYYAGGVEEGEYKLSAKEGKSLVNLGTEDLEYTISGSKLLRNAKLTITYPEHTNEETGQTSPPQDYIFKQAKAPKYEEEAYDTFEIDKALTGDWTTSDRTLSYFMTELSYSETVGFNENGIMTIHYESADLVLDRYMYYAYTAQGGTLTFSPVTDKDTQYTVNYRIGDDGNLHFVDDNTSSSIFADAFFANAVFLPSDNNTN